MATLDRQIPSPDTFFCEPWSSFVSAAKLRFVDNSPSDLRRKEPRCRGERAGMLGYRALEDFCLVVCHVCNQVVTPQGILAHYEKRHGSPAPPRSLSLPMKPKAPAVAPPVAPGAGETLAFRVPGDYPHSRFSKAPLAVYPPKGARNKPCISLPIVNLEKMPCLGHDDLASHLRFTTTTTTAASSSLKPPSLAAPQRTAPSPQGRPGPAPSTSPLDKRLSSAPSPSAPDRRPPPSPAEKKHQNGTKIPSASQRRLSGRVFDPNKHCGVQDPETKRPCTRSLTCKTHSLTYRRAVCGRTKHFDILLAEHKGRAKVNEGAKEKGASTAGKEGSSHCITATGETSSPAKPHCPNGRPLSTLKLRLANAHIPRVPASTSGPLASAPAPPAVPNLEPSARGSGAVAGSGDGSRLSSDEGDAETPKDTARPDFHSSNRHPQPLGVCLFSSRLMGRGHYVFDRRWDRMRLALQSMVEKHLNAQMWRKVPLAPESLVSLSSSGSSPEASPQTLTPATASHLRPPSNSLCRLAAFPLGASVAGTLIHDTARLVTPVSALVKARYGTQRANRPSKGSEDCVAASKGRNNSSHHPSSSSSSSSSPSSLPPTVDNVRRNGSSYHPPLHASRRPAAKKRGGNSGLCNGGEHWLSRADRPQSHNSPSSRKHATPSVPYSSIREADCTLSRPLASPSGPLAYVGGAEGRKRRSPNSYQGKMSKLSRPGGLEGLFGNGSDTVGILASGPESPRQAESHH
ncbi:ataxin-7-like protein 1 isoform 2-T2 [Spinachia spinachia]